MRYRKNPMGLLTQKEALHRPFPGVNEKAHFEQHTPHVMVWNSKRILTTSLGTPWYHPTGGQITSIYANITGVGSTATTLDFYIDGVAVTDSSISITAGDLISKPRIIKRADFQPTSKLQVQLSATGSATGPLVLTIEYVT